MDYNTNDKSRNNNKQKMEKHFYDNIQISLYGITKCVYFMVVVNWKVLCKKMMLTLLILLL